MICYRFLYSTRYRFWQEEIFDRTEDPLNQEPSTRSGRGVYSISVAAELSGIPVQSLRLYEQRGLLTPARTAGGTRRYSDDDLPQRQIRHQGRRPTKALI